MGYTHYWESCEALEQCWPQLLQDTKRIIAEANVELCRYAEDEEKPQQGDHVGGEP